MASVHDLGLVPRATLSAEKIKQKNLQVLLLGNWDGTNDLGKRSKTHEKFVIGRGQESDAIILDANISRKHSTISYDREKKTWKITDHKSLNGVKVNGQTIPAEIEHLLQDGDQVQVGPMEEYAWLFRESCFKAPFSPPENISNTSHSKVRVEAQLKAANNRIAAEKKALEDKVEHGQKLQEELRVEKVRLEQELTGQLEALEKKQKLERGEFEKTLSANQEENEKLRKRFEQKLASDKEEMLQRSNEMELKMRKRVEEEEQKFNDLLSERNMMIQMLQAEKEKAETKMEEERRLFDDKISSLEGNFKNIEKEKSKEYQDALDKLHHEFEEKLRREQRDLEDAISREKAEKESERLEKEKMRKDLEKYKAEVDKIREEQSIKRKKSEDEKLENKRKKEEFEAKLFVKCNEELKCTICDELFISPTTLNCGHVYCKFCIEQWKSRCPSGGFTCPNCRCKITGLSRSLHLENLIEALFEGVNLEAKEDRDRLLRERHEAVQNSFVSNNNDDDDDSSLLPANLRGRIGANSAATHSGRDNPELVARIRNSVDNALAAAVMAANNAATHNGGPQNRRETIFGDNFPHLRPIVAVRSAAADAPPQANALVSMPTAADVRQGIGAAARIRPSTLFAALPNRFEISLSNVGSLRPSSDTRSAAVRRSDPPIRTAVSIRAGNGTAAVVQSRETSNSPAPPQATVTAKQVRMQDGQLQYHLTNSTGSIIGEDVLPSVMQKVLIYFRRAQALALHRNEPAPNEVTIPMPALFRSQQSR